MSVLQKINELNTRGYCVSIDKVTQSVNESAID